MSPVHPESELPAFDNRWGRVVPETPFYAYGEAQLEKLFTGFQAALPKSQMPAPLHLHFAMKSNGNAHVLNWLREQGAGADLVSGGELAKARRLGFEASGLVFSGVGKSNEELAAAVKTSVALINVESRGELVRLERIARELGARANVAFRVNPDVDARTHPYISTGLAEHKFGVTMGEAWELYAESVAMPSLNVRGVSMHIGSQMMELAALDEALAKTVEFARRLKLRGIGLKVLDAGGGLGVDYRTPRKLPPFEAYGAILRRWSKEWSTLQGEGAEMYSECGRAVVAQAGVLITRVLGLKKSGKKEFAIIDASMTELLRPALYEAYHPIEFWARADGSPLEAGAEEATYDIVGPVCESSDVLGVDRRLPRLREGDLLAIGCAGAYGYVMSSTYNARPLPAEWWVPKQGAPVLSRARVFLD